MTATCGSITAPTATRHARPTETCERRRTPASITVSVGSGTVSLNTPAAMPAARSGVSARSTVPEDTIHGSVTTSGFEVPKRKGVQLHHVMTVNLSAGTIVHVVNDTGTQADNSNTGTPQFVVDYPSP